MADPTTAPLPLKRVKPPKPTPDFPLFPHATGYWAKKVRGELKYFGPWSDPDGALAKWNAQKSDLLAGRSPVDNRGAVTIRQLVNQFLTAKSHLRESGEIKDVTFVEYHATAARIIGHFGKVRLVEDVGPLDFTKLRAKLAKTMGPVTLGNEIQRVRGFFKYAIENGVIEKPVVFGSQFKKPSRKSIRIAKAKKEHKFLSAAEILALMKAAKPALKAMILLGINCGMGSRDVSELRRRHVDLVRGMLDFPRPKTGIDRRAVLWPETVEAIKAAMKERPDPAEKGLADHVFLTKFGVPWNRQAVVAVKDKRKMILSKTDAVGLEFRKLLAAVKGERDGEVVSLRREGVGFYALRHVFESVGGETGDQAAVDRVMGHDDETMAAHYRVWRKDASEDGRLRRIAEHVHGWLYGSAKAGAQGGAA